MRPLGPGHEIAPGTTVLEHLHRSNGLDVYDAWNETRACRVIVKTLRPDRLRRQGAAAKLLREGRLLRRLAHPHIVRAYEVHSLPRPTIVLETLTGSTLERLVEGGEPLSAEELANLGTHVASALRYLHRLGVLHLDVKPSNVVAEAGRAKVIDLSHARGPGRMRGGNGTWSYMAPEQVRGGTVGPAADVWGLGLLLHGAATRTTNPFADVADDLDVDDPQLHARLDPLAVAAPGLPDALARLVDACLDPDAGRRPSMDDALGVLTALT